MNNSIESNDKHGLLAEIARLYYIDKKTQQEIAENLNLSRMKINRMLKQAEEEGIVEFRVHLHSNETQVLEQEFKDYFNLKQLLVAPDAQSQNQQRINVASMVSNYLESNLRENAIVAIGMGRNVSSVSKIKTNRLFQNITFVAASGGSIDTKETSNADHICRDLALRFGGSAVSLYAPAYVPEADLKSKIMDNQVVKYTLNLAKSADFALVGIGDLSSDSHMIKLGWFSNDEIKNAKSSGVVGDLMGYDFFDKNGHPCNEILGERVVGLTINDLKQINTTIAIASESSKVTSIFAALKTGSIDVLATSLSICFAISERIKNNTAY